MDKDMTIGIEDLGLGDKTKIVFLFVHNRQVPSSGIFKDLHYLAHRHGI
jgi:hypothetical protein